MVGCNEGIKEYYLPFKANKRASTVGKGSPNSQNPNLGHRVEIV